MAEELVLNVDFDISEAEAKQRKLNAQWEQQKYKIDEIKKKIADTTTEMQALKEKQAEMREEEQRAVSKAAELEKIIERINSGKVSPQEYINLGGIADVNKQYSEALEKVKQIEQAYDKNEKALLRCEATLAKSNVDLGIEKSNLEIIGANIQKNTFGIEEQDSGIKKQEKSWGRVNQNIRKNRSALDKNLRRIKELAKSALIFSVLTKVLTAMRNTVGEIFGNDKEIAGQYAQLKNNLTVIATTLAQSIKPYLSWILDKVLIITQAVQNVLSRALGKSTAEMQKMADNMKETEKNTKKAAQAAKKATASFDTLQTAGYSNDTANSSSSGVSSSDIGELSGELQAKLDKIMAIVSAAVLALGVILVLTGVNVPLGLGMIAAGALGLWAECAANWDGFSDTLKSKIAVITAIVSSALLTLGIILIFTGANISLGIGLLIAGAIGMAAEYGTMWNSLPEKTRGIIKTIMAILGGALIVLGIILLFTGAGIPLGIGLILAGCASLASAVAADPNGFLTRVKNFVGKIGEYFSKCWDGVKNGFKAMVIGIIKIANIWIDGLNTLLIPMRGIVYGIAKAFGSDIKFSQIAIPHIPIPKLATGAVIPGGRPFPAILGDQRAGQTNIEAPLDTIVEAVKLAIGEPKFSIEAKGSMAQLIKMLNLEIQREQNRASLF